MAIKIVTGTQVEEVVRELDLLTKPYGGLGAYGREDHFSDMFVRNELDQLWAMTYVVPTIFLAIAGFLMHMVLSRLVNLEREQIGILKALGFSGREVGGYYIKLALVIALVGLVFGIGVGLWFGSTNEISGAK